MRRLSRRTSNGPNGDTNGSRTPSITSKPGTINGSISSNGNGRNRIIKNEPQSIMTLRETMNYLKYEWPQVLRDNANPIEMAISLLDDSSVGMSHKKPEFEKISEETSGSLRAVVNDYHDIFNNSVGSYHYLLSTSSKNQQDCGEIKSMLESTSKEIHDKSDVLQDLNQTSSRYSEMIEILDAMESLNNVPYKIDQLIYDKKIHEIYDVIFHSYNLADKYNLWNLSAMTSIKTYLDSQSNNLFDIIIDELQNEIYLKSQFTSNSPDSVEKPLYSWENLINLNNSKLSGFKNFITKSNNFEQFVYNAANLDLEEISSILNENFQHFLTNQTPKLSTNPAASTKNQDLSLLIDVSDTHRSYNYIYQLINTLFKLNRLNQAIDILNHSSQQEIHGVMYRATEEVKSINLSELSRLNKVLGLDNNEFNHYTVTVLKSLFSTTFIKSLLIVQNQKILQSILGLYDIEYDFKTTWDIIKTELTNLMLTYITTDTINGVIKKNNPSAQIFKFENLNFDDTLVNKFSTILDIEDRELYIENETFQTNFEVLVPVNILNMRVIIEFFLIFISSTNFVLNEAGTTANTKPSNKTSINMFENFMKMSFLPNLRNYLTKRFDDLMGVHDLEQDHNGFDVEIINISTKSNPQFKFGQEQDIKVFKNGFQFKNFLINACTLLNTSLTYRPELNDLILSFITKFSNSYQAIYESIIGNSNSKTNLWIKTPALFDLSHLIISKDLSSGQTLQQLIDKEVSIMLNNDVFDITKDDLLDDDSLDKLIHIVVTINWIMTWLPSLKKLSNYNYKENLTSIEKLKHDWNFLDNGKVIGFESSSIINTETSAKESNKETKSFNEELNIYLVLDSIKITQFDEILNKLLTIKSNSIILMRHNLRLKAIYYISRSFKFNNWVLINEPGDSDEYIAKFNKEIFSFENKLDDYLESYETNQILLGYSTFLNMTLIKGSSLVKKINNNGIKRIIINIFTLKQMLKNLSKDDNDIDFQYCSDYFNHFTTNENMLLDSMKGYSKNEMVNLVRLIYSEKLADGNGSSFNVGKFNDMVSKINKLH